MNDKFINQPMLINILPNLFFFYSFIVTYNKGADLSAAMLDFFNFVRT